MNDKEVSPEAMKVIISRLRKMARNYGSRGQIDSVAVLAHAIHYIQCEDHRENRYPCPHTGVGYKNE